MRSPRLTHVGFGEGLLEVRPEEARDYLKVASWAMLASLFNAVVFVVAAWGLAPHTHLIAWFIFSALLFTTIYLHVIAIDPKRLRRVSSHAVKLMCTFALASASPWILMVWLFLAAGPPSLDATQLQICAGMAAGGAFAMHRVRVAAVCYFGSILLAAAVFCLWREPDSLWMSSLYCLPFALMLWIATNRSAKTAREREQSLRETSEALQDLTVANLEITRLAYQDSVTELPNRQAFSGRLATLVEARAVNREPFGVLLLDLDRFKSVNDTLGHDAGDALLVAVGSRLQRLFQDRGFVARLGGDEFAVVLENAADAAEIQLAAQRAVTEIARPISIEQVTLHSGVSIGSALFPDHALKPKDLLRHADMALADAKLNGRGRAVSFDPSMSARAERTERIERQLRAALLGRELKLWYQPQFDLETGAMVGAEALLRWPRPDGTFLSPELLFSVAEERGLVAPVSDFVFEQVTDDLTGWLAEGLSPPRISVNIHSLDLKSPRALVERLDAIEAAGVSPKRLALEVTEGCVVGRGSDQAVDVLRDIVGRGFLLSLDDFGTGHASLIHLRNLPVGEMKIDKSFVAGMLENAEDRAIVRAAIEVARSLRLSCVAEGVETEEQRRELLSMLSGALELKGQGWLWSKALAPDAFSRLLRESASSSTAA